MVHFLWIIKFVSNIGVKELKYPVKYCLFCQPSQIQYLSLIDFFAYALFNQKAKLNVSSAKHINWIYLSVYLQMSHLFRGPIVHYK